MIAGPWTEVQSEYEGTKMFVRANTGYKDFDNRAEYDHQVGLAVPFNAPQTNGIPSDEEAKELEAIEQTIREIFEKDAISLLVAVITTGGMREFVLYTRDAETVKTSFKGLNAHVKGHKVQLMIRPDTQWTTYKAIATQS